MKLYKTIKLDQYVTDTYTCSRQMTGCSEHVHLEDEGVVLDDNYKIIDSNNNTEPVYCLCNWCLNGLEFDDNDKLIIEE